MADSIRQLMRKAKRKNFFVPPPTKMAKLRHRERRRDEDKKKNWAVLSADYAEIETRVLAHMADPAYPEPQGELNSAGSVTGRLK